MIIDFHVHCFPEELAYKAIPMMAEEAGIKACLNGTIKDLKKSMGKSKIDYSVMQPIATKISQNRKINEWSALYNNNDGIISFGTVHPDTVEWKQEIDFICNAGLPGIKFHPDYQKFYVDEKRMFPIYEYIFERNLIVLFHAGVDIGLPAPYHCSPERLLKIIKAFPESKVVAAHMGGYLYWEQVEELLIGKNIYFDTSYSYHKLGRCGFERIISLHGAERILFATDSPWADQEEEVMNINSLCISNNDKDKILFYNAKELLNL